MLLDIRSKFYRLQDRVYPKQFLLDMFSEVHYDSVKTTLGLLEVT